MIELKKDLRYVNKEKIEEITKLAISDRVILNNLIEIALQHDEYISQHAALIVQSIVKTDSEIIVSFLPKIIESIPNFKNDSQLGNFIEILEYVDFDCSKIYDFCFDLIESSDKPGFVKIYSIKMLGIAAKKDEVLQKRLVEYIEEKQVSIKSKYLKKEALNVLSDLRKLK